VTYPPIPVTEQTYTIPPTVRRNRADKILARAFPEHSRVAFHRSFDAGLVKIAGKPIPRDQEVVGGMEISFAFPDLIPSGVRAVEISLQVIFEDKHMLAINKAAGMVVHPGAGTRDDTLVHAAETLVEAVHLTAEKDRLVGELAYGQQRQLEIALALSGAPRFILFDEPAAGLSPTERRDLVSILTTLPSHIGYIIIEHDMDVALRVVESVTMMHNGRIFKEGRPEEIEEDPEVQELYLGGGHE